MKTAKSDKKALKEKKLSGMSEKELKKYRMKKALGIVLIVFVIFVVLYFALDFANEKLLEDAPSVTGVKQETITHPTYPVFSAEWNKNVFEDETYMSLNTTIMYGDLYSGNLYEVDEDSISYHEGYRFFEKYFSTLQKGDYKTYSTLFEDEYNAEKSFETDINRKFPPQMVYDITVKEAGRFEGEHKGKHVTRGVYIVDYKIYKNNMLFRRDIGYSNELETDSSRPLVFELITYGANTSNEKTYIHALYTESSITAQ